MSEARIILGDCLTVLPTLEAGSVDAVVTDPPAGIAFMGASWDRFGGRGNKNAERDRDSANRGPGAGLGNQPFGYSGSAMPTPGQREAFIAFLSEVAAQCLRVTKPGGYALVWAIPRTSHWTATALENGGWQIRDRISHLFGTGFPKGKGCLKPACEDWWLCRKPGPRVLPLGIDECRVSGAVPAVTGRGLKNGAWRGKEGREDIDDSVKVFPAQPGRYPANVVHDGSEEVLEAFAAFGESKSGNRPPGRNGKHGETGWRMAFGGQEHGDSGTAARFFYTAKASRAERGEGNTHPTVKPLALMEWLVKLVSRVGETVLDPFLGSGTTALACAKMGRVCIGIEKDADYFAIAERRLAEARAALPLFAGGT